jgi:hypothetical protein
MEIKWNGGREGLNDCAAEQGWVMAIGQSGAAWSDGGEVWWCSSVAVVCGGAGGAADGRVERRRVPRQANPGMGWYSLVALLGQKFCQKAHTHALFCRSSARQAINSRDQ